MARSADTCRWGRTGLAFGSGVSAIKAVTMLLNAGDHIIVSNDVYGGSTQLWRKHVERTGITFTYVNTLDVANIENAIRPETKVSTSVRPVISCFGCFIIS